MEPIKGYCVLTDTLSGWELVWNTIDTTGEDDIVLPEVFQTERDAQLEILDDMRSDIQQFRDEERKWEEIHWPNEYHIAHIEIDESENITVWDEGVSKDIRHVIVETTLTEWRQGL